MTNLGTIQISVMDSTKEEVSKEVGAVITKDGLIGVGAHFLTNSRVKMVLIIVTEGCSLRVSIMMVLIVDGIKIMRAVGNLVHVAITPLVDLAGTISLDLIGSPILGIITDLVHPTPIREGFITLNLTITVHVIETNQIIIGPVMTEWQALGVMKSMVEEKGGFLVAMNDSMEMIDKVTMETIGMVTIETADTMPMKMRDTFTMGMTHIIFTEMTDMLTMGRVKENTMKTKVIKNVKQRNSLLKWKL